MQGVMPTDKERSEVGGRPRLTSHSLHQAETTMSLCSRYGLPSYAVLTRWTDRQNGESSSWDCSYKRRHPKAVRYGDARYRQKHDCGQAHRHALPTGGRIAQARWDRLI